MVGRMRKKADVRVCERMREREREGRTNIVQQENFENKTRKTDRQREPGRENEREGGRERESESETKNFRSEMNKRMCVYLCGEGNCKGDLMNDNDDDI